MFVSIGQTQAGAPHDLRSFSLALYMTRFHDPVFPLLARTVSRLLLHIRAPLAPKRYCLCLCHFLNVRSHTHHIPKAFYQPTNHHSVHHYPHVLTMRLKAFTSLAILITTARAGPAAYGVCQAGCAGIAVACYSAAGAVMGVTAGAAAPPAVLACNAAYGSCQAACWAALALPTV